MKHWRQAGLGWAIVLVMTEVAAGQADPAKTPPPARSAASTDGPTAPTTPAPPKNKKRAKKREADGAAQPSEQARAKPATAQAGATPSHPVASTGGAAQKPAAPSGPPHPAAAPGAAGPAAPSGGGPQPAATANRVGADPSAKPAGATPATPAAKLSGPKCSLAEPEQPRGGRLDVIGSGFGQTPLVRIAGKPAPMLERREDRLSVQVPADSNGGPVSVQANGQTGACGALVIIGKNR